LESTFLGLSGNDNIINRLFEEGRNEIAII